MATPLAALETPAAATPSERSGASPRERPAEHAGVLARFVAASLWIGIGKLVAMSLAQQPILSLLGGTSVVLVTGAALFGWVGVAVGAVLQVLYLGTLEGFDGPYAYAASAGYTGAAVIAWLTFRYVPGVSRRFPNVRTILAFLAAGAAGVVCSTGMITGFSQHVDDFWGQVALWSRSTIASVWVFAPALILLGERLLRRFTAAIPDEIEPTPPRRVALVKGSLPGQPLQVTDVETSALRLAPVLARGLAVVTAITVAKLLLAGDQGHNFAWWNLLYLVPIWWLAQLWRMPGAMLAVGVVGAGSLGSDAVLSGGAQLPLTIALALYAPLLGYLFVGVLLGASGEREGRLLEGLAELNERLEQDLQRVVKALTGAAAAKDEYTEGHLRRVNAYALEVGRRLGLGARELELLQIASTLHDIGKIGIPEPILNKPGPLSDSEREVMQRHPEIGARMLSRIDGLREAAPLVLHHQERWDGRRDGEFPGYPAGLAGDAIPVGARIIAVVDAFDAMTTDRP